MAMHLNPGHRYRLIVNKGTKESPSIAGNPGSFEGQVRLLGIRYDVVNVDEIEAYIHAIYDWIVDVHSENYSKVFSFRLSHIDAENSYGLT